MSNKISLNYSPNFNSKKRKSKDIQFIILHYTGMKNDKKSIARLTQTKSSVSCHYYIDKNGKVIVLVPDLYTAWHAGKSKWKKFNSINKNSIGIEISNPGHEFGYKKFSNKQINSLKKLLFSLMKRYFIKKENILAHSDIAPMIKKDPGEKFPWKDLSKKKLCLWHSLESKDLKQSRNKKVNFKKQKLFFDNLLKIGYRIPRIKKEKKYFILAFQRRFRPELIVNNIDEECYLISKNLT